MSQVVVNRHALSRSYSQSDSATLHCKNLLFKFKKYLAQTGLRGGKNSIEVLIEKQFSGRGKLRLVDDKNLKMGRIVGRKRNNLDEKTLE